jgi:hypothetical protein
MVTKNITVTDSFAGACGAMEFLITYGTWINGTADLIKMASPTSTSVNFATSTNPNDVRKYTVTVLARFIGK